MFSSSTGPEVLDLRRRARGAAKVAVVLAVAAATLPASASAKVIRGGWHAPVVPMPAASAGFLANECGHRGRGSYIEGHYHTGTDLPRPVNAPVFAVGRGTVVFAGSFGGGWGNAIFIQHKSADGTPFQVLYGHINIRVASGARVDAGQRIGTIYNLSGPHLHLGLIPGTGHPSSGWGLRPCGLWPSTNGFVDALPWLAAHRATKRAKAKPKPKVAPKTPTAPAPPAAVPPAPSTPTAPAKPVRKVITIDNRVTNGASMREDSTPVRLTTKPWKNCGSRGCNIAGTERVSGQKYDAAVCQTTGERITNGNDHSSSDDTNPARFTSTRYYGVRLADRRFGYVSEIWIDKAFRGGLGLPQC